MYADMSVYLAYPIMSPFFARDVVGTMVVNIMLISKNIVINYFICFPFVFAQTECVLIGCKKYKIRVSSTYDYIIFYYICQFFCNLDFLKGMLKNEFYLFFQNRNSILGGCTA